MNLLYSVPQQERSTRDDTLERALRLAEIDPSVGYRAQAFRELRDSGRFRWDNRLKTLAQYNSLTGTLKVNPDRAGVDVDYRNHMYRVVHASSLDDAQRQDKLFALQAEEFHRDVCLAAALLHEMNHRELGVHPWDRRRDEFLAYRDEVHFYDFVATVYARRSDDEPATDAQKIGLLTWLQHARADVVLTARTQEGLDLNSPLP